MPSDPFLIPLAWRAILEMTGRDRARFLHGMCTNDIKKLQPGQGCMAAIVNRQGKMVADVVVHAAENALLLQMDRSLVQGVIDHMGKFLVADDVTLKPSAASILGIYGAKARGLLGLPELPDFHGLLRDGVYIARNRTLGVDGYDLIIPETKPGEAGRLLAHGVAQAGADVYEALRIANGFPRWGVDMDGSMLPMEAGLEPIAISYSKGCYVGQEVIQRVKTYSEPPNLLVSLAVEGAGAPPVPAPLRADGQEVGRATSAAFTDRAFALAVVRKEHKAPGTALQLGDRKAVVRAMPWQAALTP